MSNEQRSNLGKSQQNETLTLGNDEEAGFDRTPREDRAAQARPSDSWKPASILPTPEPRDGIAYRWVRTSTFGKIDNKNVSQKFREGWIPCLASEHEDLKILSDRGSTFTDNIEVGGLLLCQGSTEMVKQRREYHDNLTAGRMKAVDQGFMQENDARLPKFTDRQSRTTNFGEG